MPENYKPRVRTDKQEALRHARKIMMNLEHIRNHLKDLPVYEADYAVIKIMLKEELPLLMESAKILIEEIMSRPAINNLL